MIDWEKHALSDADHALALKIADRAFGMLQHALLRGRIDWVLDIQAAHMINAPLDLKALLAAPDAEFREAVVGIYRFLNRRTGKFADGFVPAFLKNSVAVPIRI